MIQSKAIIFPQQGRAEIVTISVGDPGPGEVLVRNEGCGICQMEIRRFKGIGSSEYPAERLGHEGIGEVVAIGAGVTHVQSGDLVTTLWYPSFQQYTVGRADWAMRIDKSHATHPHLLISEPAACALNGALAAAPAPADSVCICGAGYMGLLILQFLCRSLAKSVSVIDLDANRRALAIRLGATTAIDPATRPASQEHASVVQYDVVVEATGAPSMILNAARMVRQGGRLVVFGEHGHQVETVDWKSFDCKQVIFANPLYSSDFAAIWRQAVALLETGIIDQTPLITHVAPSEQCQAIMEIAASQSDGYLKGYLSWKPGG